MIRVIEEKEIPIYRSECPECHSIFDYTKTEIYSQMIQCPVCRNSMWASTIADHTESANIFKTREEAAGLMNSVSYGESNNV